MKNVCITSFNMSIDWNNIDIKALDKKQSIKYIILQGEYCKDKKKHIQGFIQFHSKKEMTFIKKLLQDNTLHIEKMRGTPKQARDYCSDIYTDEKGESKDIWMKHIEYGELDETTERQRSDLIELKNKIVEGQRLNKILLDSDDNKEIHNILMYNKTLKALELEVRQNKCKNDLVEEYKKTEWKEWQQKILAKLEEKPDGRTIQWIHENTGNIGKSYLGDYIVANKDAFHITGGKKADILFAYEGQEIIIIDLPRDDTENKDQQEYIYNVIETLLGRVYLNTKYESKMVFKPKAHIIIFANNPPKTSKLSNDRWDITDLNQTPKDTEILEEPTYTDIDSESSDEPCKPSNCIPYKIDRTKKHKHTTLNQLKKLKKRPPTPNAIRSDYSDSDEFEQDIRKMDNYNKYILKEIERQNKRVENLY